MEVDVADHQLVEQVAQLAPLADPVHQVPLGAAPLTGEVLVDAGARPAQPAPHAVHPGEEPIGAARCAAAPGPDGGCVTSSAQRPVGHDLPRLALRPPAAGTRGQPVFSHRRCGG